MEDEYEDVYQEEKDYIEQTINKAGNSGKDLIQGKQNLSINKKRSNKGNKTKTCPYCSSEIKKRVKNKCPNCGEKLFMVDGEYYTISEPQERLIVHCLAKTVTELLSVDVLDAETVKEYMPSADDFSVVKLKNEAWSANRLLQECKGNIRLAIKVIDVAYESYGLGRRTFTLYNIVSQPLFRALVGKARGRLYQDRLRILEQKESIKNQRNKQNAFGSPFQKEELDIE